jgi:hypothetical protein
MSKEVAMPDVRENSTRYLILALSPSTEEDGSIAVH